MNILICDDDKLSVQECRSRLQEVAAKHGVPISVRAVESGKQLLFFQDTKFADVDLIYLDQNMPGLTGVETAKQLRKMGVTADIVFYTVDETKALDGYDVDALHYIVKGKTTPQKFEEIFLKAVSRAGKRNVEMISLSCAGEHINVPVQDILYFEVQKRIVTIYWRKGSETKQFDFYSPLSKIEEFLNGKGFVRIHSSYLVASQYIYKRGPSEVEMINGALIPIGKTYRNKL